MFKWLSNLFSAPSRWGFYKLHSQIVYWKTHNIFPNSYDLPESIEFPSKLWKQVFQMYKGTYSDGRERAVSVFWVDGDIVFSPQVKGRTDSVTTNANVRVEYKPIKDGYYQKTVYLNNKTYSKAKISQSKVPKEVKVTYLFNMHTHPYHQTSHGKEYYFFSDVDINTLLRSNAILTVLITDRVYVLFRTNSVKKTKVLQSECSKDNLSSEGFVLYEGEFKKKLVRYSLHPELE